MPDFNPTSRIEAAVYEENGIVQFPALVHLPAPARPNGDRLLGADDADLVKFMTLCARIRPGSLVPFKKQIATRWGIDSENIVAITATYNGQRIVIESDEDWDDWTGALFFPIKNYKRLDYIAPKKLELRFSAVDIKVLLNTREELSAQASASSSSGASHTVSTSNDINVHGFGDTPTIAGAIGQRQQRQQQRQQEQQQRQRSIPQPGSNAAAASPSPESIPAPPQAQPLPQLHSLGSTIANNVTQSVLQALQPLSRDLPSVVSSILSELSSQMGSLPTNQASTNDRVSQTDANLSSSSTSGGASQTPSTVRSPVGLTPEAPLPNVESQQRQSLLEGMLDELGRVRTSRTTLSSSRLQQTFETPTSTTDEASMNTELTQAFAEMLAQRNATEQSVTESREDDEESLSIISTPSESPRRPRSHSRSRSPSRRALLSDTTLTILTIFTLLLVLVTPSLATPATSLSFSSLNPRDLAGSSPRNLHLCKCTCFQTNSTLVPLYAPLDAAKPCGTCTRQFCLDQGLDICKGAKLPHTDHDTGTGLEGDVWAKCFERDSGKDQGIITLYVLVIVGLVAWAGLRGRVGGWVREYQTMGPGALASAVRNAPWRRSGR